MAPKRPLGQTARDRRSRHEALARGSGVGEAVRVPCTRGESTQKERTQAGEKTVKAEGGLQRLASVAGLEEEQPQRQAAQVKVRRWPVNYKSTWDKDSKEHRCTSGRTARGEADGGLGERKINEILTEGKKKSPLEGALSTLQIDKIYIQGQQRLYGARTSQIQLSREQSGNEADKKNPDSAGGRGKTPHPPQTHWPLASLTFNWPFTFQCCPTPQSSQLTAS